MWPQWHIHGLYIVSSRTIHTWIDISVQDHGIPIANALETPQSCIKPSTSGYVSSDQWGIWRIYIQAHIHTQMHIHARDIRDWINSLLFSTSIWRHCCGLTLVQIMARCQTHQAITWTNAALSSIWVLWFSPTVGLILQDLFIWILIRGIRFKYIHKLLLHLSWANELISKLIPVRCESSLVYTDACACARIDIYIYIYLYIFIYIYIYIYIRGRYICIYTLKSALSSRIWVRIRVWVPNNLWELSSGHRTVFDSTWTKLRALWLVGQIIAAFCWRHKPGSSRQEQPRRTYVRAVGLT